MTVSVRDKRSGLLSYIQLSHHIARLKQLEVQTLNDKTLKSLAYYVAQGWVKLQKQLNSELQPCYSFRDDLTVVNDIILKDSKIVIRST